MNSINIFALLITSLSRSTHCSTKRIMRTPFVIEILKAELRRYDFLNSQMALWGDLENALWLEFLSIEQKKMLMYRE